MVAPWFVEAPLNMSKTYSLFWSKWKICMDIARTSIFM